MHSGSVPIEWPSGSGRRSLEASTTGVRGPLRPLLLPLEQLYRGAIALRNQAYDAGWFKTHRVSVPVLSVGNLVAGGAGKTPVTRWLTEQLLARERRPAVLHGGYGSDEPRLHQQWHPEVLVIAQRDRVAAARAAIAGGADVILLDDGFQHRRIARDLDIVLLPAEAVHAQLLPLGPGREPLGALQRGDYALVTRKTAEPERAIVLETRIHQVAPEVPTGRVQLALKAAIPAGPVVAVCAIARPDLFATQLARAGMQLELLLAYPDHYDYTAADAAYIVRRAGGRLLVTTEKDEVKLRPLLNEQPLHVVHQEVVFESGAAALQAALDNVL